MRQFCAKCLIGLMAVFAPLTGANAAEPWWKGALIYEIYPRSFQDFKRRRHRGHQRHHRASGPHQEFGHRRHLANADLSLPAG